MSIENVTARSQWVTFTHRDTQGFTATVTLDLAEVRELIGAMDVEANRQIARPNARTEDGAADPRNDRPNTDDDPEPEDTETCKCGAIIPKGYGTCDDCAEISAIEEMKARGDCLACGRPDSSNHLAGCSLRPR